MSDYFLGEIRIFGCNFAPRDWAFCNGQLMAISQNTGLFSLLGTYYGGDGRTTFALPNLQGRAPISLGQGPGLSPRSIGDRGGSAAVALIQTEMPAHTHGVAARSSRADRANAQAAMLASGAEPLYVAGAPTVPMSPQGVAVSGVGIAHNNMQPYLVLNFCIALRGIFPPRP